MRTLSITAGHSSLLMTSRSERPASGLLDQGAVAPTMRRFASTGSTRSCRRRSGSGTGTEASGSLVSGAGPGHDPLYALLLDDLAREDGHHLAAGAGDGEKSWAMNWVVIPKRMWKPMIRSRDPQRDASGRAPVARPPSPQLARCAQGGTGTRSSSAAPGAMARTVNADAIRSGGGSDAGGAASHRLTRGQPAPEEGTDLPSPEHDAGDRSSRPGGRRLPLLRDLAGGVRSPALFEGLTRRVREVRHRCRPRGCGERAGDPRGW